MHQYGISSKQKKKKKERKIFPSNRHSCKSLTCRLIAIASQLIVLSKKSNIFSQIVHLTVNSQLYNHVYLPGIVHRSSFLHIAMTVKRA